MSNHDGSYMLNAVLNLLIQNDFFKEISKSKKKEFIDEIFRIGDAHDCNDGEILSDLGSILGFCYYCREPVSEVNEDDLCTNCCDE